MWRSHSAGFRFLIALSVAILIGAVIVGCRSIFARPPYDADTVGRSETAMWKAYYTGEKPQLALNLIKLLRTQFGMTLPEARSVAGTLADAAMTFKATRETYDDWVLPDLTEAYRPIKHYSNASFDPEQAARAELAWWVARRTPGQSSPEQVGAKIGELYAVLYGSQNPAFRKAGLLRAQAAALRDSGKLNADWPRIEDMLKESSREAQQGMP